MVESSALLVRGILDSFACYNPSLELAKHCGRFESPTRCIRCTQMISTASSSSASAHRSAFKPHVLPPDIPCVQASDFNPSHTQRTQLLYVAINFSLRYLAVPAPGPHHVCGISRCRAKEANVAFEVAFDRESELGGNSICTKDGTSLAYSSRSGIFPSPQRTTK